MVGICARAGPGQGLSASLLGKWMGSDVSVFSGKAYRPRFALVETADKRAVVKINDVGPLKPGRIIDLNEQAMQYFDPTMQRGVIKSVKVTPLPGEDWIAGPV